MNGLVDGALRALVDIQIGNTYAKQEHSVTAWIDTAFDGFFVFPKKMIDDLDLQQEALTDAILADGSRVRLESYVCYVDWFGKIVPAQVIANEGKLPLLGTEFLSNRKLVVDYVNKTVSIN